MRFIFSLLIVGIFSIVAFAPAYAQEEEGAYGYEFCENPTRARAGGGTDSDCIVSCTKLSNLIDDGTLTLADAFDSKGFGVCTGAATDIARTIYKLELAQDGASLQTSRCTIWEGEMAVSFSGKSAGDVIDTSEPIDVSQCEAGSYDTLFWTISRFTTYSGDTVYLHDPGERVRTQSTSVDSVEDATLGSGSPDESLTPEGVYDSGRAGTPSLAGFSNVPVADAPWLNLYNGTAGNTDLLRETRKFTTSFVTDTNAPSANGIMDFDELSLFTGTSARSGYFCDESLDYVCARAISGDNTKMEWLLKTGEEGIVSGLPVNISANTNLNVEIGYFAPRSGEEELGLWYTFYHRAVEGDTQAVGAHPGEDGMWVTITSD